MSPDEYQERAWRLCKETSDLHLYCGLAAEVGEVLALIQKSEYKDTAVDWSDMEAELGDVLWYVACLCEKWDLSLEGVLESNIKKLEARHGRSSK